MATEKDGIPAGSLRLDWIQEQVQTGRYLFTLHGDAERRNDGFTVADVESRPVHIVCGKNNAGSLVIITVYRPGPPKWRTPWEREKQP